MVVHAIICCSNVDSSIFSCGFNGYIDRKRRFWQNFMTLHCHSFIFIYQKQSNLLFSIYLAICRNFFAPQCVTMELVTFFPLISQLLSLLSFRSNIKKRQNRYGGENQRSDVLITRNSGLWDGIVSYALLPHHT